MEGCRAAHGGPGEVREGQRVGASEDRGGRQEMRCSRRRPSNAADSRPSLSGPHTFHIQAGAGQGTQVRVGFSQWEIQGTSGLASGPHKTPHDHR